MFRLILSLRNCLLGFCCAWALVFLGLGGASAQDAGDAPINSVLDVHRAIVYVEAVGTFVPPAEKDGAIYISQGSGFLIAPEGLIVTNAHVVNGGEIFYVRMDGDDTRYNARLVGISECADLAVLALAATGHTSPLPYLEFDPEEVREDMLVSAFGYPEGADELVRSRGRITALPDRVDTRWASIYGVLWHSARLAHGSSGGPLVAASGKVVGVNYAGSMEDDEYAAIGSAYALPVLEALRSGQNLYSLGINGEVIEESGAAEGVWVVSVKAGSAADKAGLLPGDLVVELAGLPVGEYGSMDTYCDIIRSHGAGDVLPVTVMRGDHGELWTGQLNGQPLAAAPAAPAAAAAPPAAALAEEDRVPASSTGKAGAKARDDRYELLITDSQAIAINVPVGWEIMEAEPLDTGAAHLGEMLFAANLGAIDDGGDLAAIQVAASRAIPGWTLQDTLDAYAAFDDCEWIDRVEVQMAEYAGLRDRWRACDDGTLGTLHVYALTPTRAPNAFVVLSLFEPDAIALDPETILAPLAESLAQQGEIGAVYTATVLADILNVREEPGTEYTIVGRLAAGEVVEVWAVDQWPAYQWLLVWADDVTGWVAASEEYVQLDPRLLAFCAETTCVLDEAGE